MQALTTTEGYQLTLSKIYDGLMVRHPERPRHEEYQFRLINNQYVETLWRYFDDPARALLKQQVSSIDMRHAHEGSGLKVWPIFRPSERNFIVLSDAEVAAFYELYTQLDGQLPLLVMEGEIS